MVIKPRGVEDIAACVDMYMVINEDSFLHIDRAYSIKMLSLALQQGRFFRVKLNQYGKIEAWIMAIINRTYHDPEPFLQQIYYCSSNIGIKAYRDVVELHSAMEQEAMMLNISTVKATGNHSDINNVYARILEKIGWERRGYLCIKKLTNPKSTV